MRILMLNSVDRNAIFAYFLDMPKAKSKKKGRPKLVRADEAPERYNVMLDRSTADWGQQQPGGLSATLRKLLREAFEKAQTSKKG
jgi:hypothetical protein